MTRRRRARARGTGAMVLDNEGVSKAATDRAMYVRLKVAYDDGHHVLTSAAVLAEVLRGTSRDAGLHRVLTRGRSSILDYGMTTYTIPASLWAALSTWRG